ncbi:hypothetical protein HYY73_06630 [Candidatus Woesearchaeota archaeon]|nr:hypothetical protein [Candidatus Woesearchaeota archaeon]
MATEAKQIDIFDRKVFELARKMPNKTPEPFFALEEYDRIGKLRINFTLDPALYKDFKEYCEKHGRQMSKFLESAMKRRRQRIFK